MPKQPRRLKILAPAKINLFLIVCGKRPDGYHDLISLFQMVGLFDELVFEPCREGLRLTTKPRMSCPDAENLIIRAARLLAERSGVSIGARIRLTKNIPIGGGLGGGSSDAAATLVGLNRLWRLRLSRRELAKMGETLGSDVPFFLYGPAALVGGRGDRILPAVIDRPKWLVLVNPGFEVSTRWVYQNLTPRTGSQLDRGISGHGIRKSWLTTLRNNNRIGGSGKIRVRIDPARAQNDLERVTESKYPVIKKIKATLTGAGAHGALMAGSGPTVFGLFGDRRVASAAARLIRRNRPDWKIWVSRGLARPPF